MTRLFRQPRKKSRLTGCEIRSRFEGYDFGRRFRINHYLERHAMLPGAGHDRGRIRTRWELLVSEELVDCEDFDASRLSSQRRRDPADTDHESHLRAADAFAAPTAIWGAVIRA